MLKPLGILTTSTLRSASSVQKFLRNQLRIRRVSAKDVTAVYVSSVVPPVDASLRRALTRLFSVTPVFISSKTPSRIKIRYRVPSEVGADRLVNARAAMALAPKRPAIVVDFGTATTFDCITATGAYLGGVIAPGPAISAEALYQRTAKLPRVLLSHPARILGRNTLESIEAGLYHGYRGLVHEIVCQLEKNMGPRTVVFATGGQAHWILKGVRGVDRFVPEMTMWGIYHFWRDKNPIRREIRG